MKPEEWSRLKPRLDAARLHGALGQSRLLLSHNMSIPETGDVDPTAVDALIGAGVSILVRTLVPSIPATLSYLWVSIGFAISVGVGLFFGYYPANLAANLDPIVCLRYE